MLSSCGGVALIIATKNVAWHGGAYLQAAASGNLPHAVCPWAAPFHWRAMWRNVHSNVGRGHGNEPQ